MILVLYLGHRTFSLGTRISFFFLLAIPVFGLEKVVRKVLTSESEETSENNDGWCAAIVARVKHTRYNIQHTTRLWHATAIPARGNYGNRLERKVLRTAAKLRPPTTSRTLPLYGQA